MPQKRSRDESLPTALKELQRNMLPNINLIYLASRVLILADLTPHLAVALRGQRGILAVL